MASQLSCPQWTCGTWVWMSASSFEGSKVLLTLANKIKRSKQGAVPHWFWFINKVWIHLNMVCKCCLKSQTGGFMFSSDLWSFSDMFETCCCFFFYHEPSIHPCVCLCIGRLRERSHSVWPQLWKDRAEFTNPLYKAELSQTQGVLRPNTTPYCFKWVTAANTTVLTNLIYLKF